MLTKAIILTKCNNYQLSKNFQKAWNGKTFNSSPFLPIFRERVSWPLRVISSIFRLASERLDARPRRSWYPRDSSSWTERPRRPHSCLRYLSVRFHDRAQKDIGEGPKTWRDVWMKITTFRWLGIKIRNSTGCSRAKHRSFGRSFNVKEPGLTWDTLYK